MGLGVRSISELEFLMRKVVESELGGLPKGVRSRYVEDVNGLRMHILESGFEVPGRPCVLLLHVFP